jgi:TDG/mug DNA glycosylase family protein
MRDEDSRTVPEGASRTPKGGSAARATDTAEQAIPDVVARELRVLFCGINPGRVSAAAAAHFANPRNDFWRLLHAARFTPRELAPHEQWEALDYGVGITNAAHRTTPGSSDLRRGDFAGAAERLERFAHENKPAWMAFVGKEAYRGAFGERAELGLQQRTFESTHLFVLPSTSPANAAVPWSERLRWFEKLARVSAPVVRPAVRALLLDREGRVFLHRFVRPDDPGFWFAPGGAIEAGESDEAALRRELSEELALDHVEVGPWIWHRRHIWHWPAQRIVFDSRERFAVVRGVDPNAVRPTGVDALQFGANMVEEYRWWTPDEIERSRDSFAPRRLAAFVRDLLEHGPPSESIDVGR